VSAGAVSEPQASALAALGGRVSTIAHEVRNLLGPIDLYASLLAEQCAPSPDLAPLSGRLMSGVKQLGAMTANLLALSRRPLVDLEPIDLGRIVAESLEGIALSLRGTSIALRRRLDTTAKAMILGEETRLRQALLNLLLNAVQAMGERGTLTVGLVERDGRIELVVRDTGVGMDRATLARATESFFTTRPNGTGLGLAVVREVAELHGAELGITSRPGRGTAVRLGFPLHVDMGDLRR